MGLFNHSDNDEKPTGISREEALLSVPALNPGLECTYEENGTVTLLVTSRRRSKGFWSRFQAPIRSKSYHLDCIGAYVLQNIDGERNVRQLSQLLVEKYKLNQREALLSLANFIKSLTQRNIIAIGIKASRDN